MLAGSAAERRTESRAAGADLGETAGVDAWAERPASLSARLGPSGLQWAVAAAVTLALAAGLKQAPLGLFQVLYVGFFAVFSTIALWRVVLIEAGLRRRRPALAALPDEALPRYTVIAPLYREPQMVAGLLAALAALDYPRERLQVLLALEADDPETLAAAQAAIARCLLDVAVVLSPTDGPRTKPKACNAALARATGELVTVYDAEDRPGLGQLREAAARFAANGADIAAGRARRSGRLGCLQAPLRIVEGRGWLQRQFALEYAALFETALPGYAALGMPFPLGGTSNHFVVQALREAGGWDSWNVTEDADLGFRLPALGWRLDVLDTPTWETAPRTLAIWRPQRTRWIKGYMQTWGVHMRAPHVGGWRRVLALQLSVGAGLVSSVMHGALALGVAACGLLALVDMRAPQIAPVDLALLVGGWASAVAAMAEGERARGGRLTPFDAVSALVYWPLQSLAAVSSAWQLVRAPFHWDKTPHEPPELETADGAAG